MIIIRLSTNCVLWWWYSDKCPDSRPSLMSIVLSNPNIIKHRLHVWSGQHSANRRMVTSRSTTWRTADNTFLHFFVVQSLSHSGSSHCLGHVTRDDDTWPQSTGALLQPADVHTCVPSLHSARLCKHEHRITLLYAQLKELNPFWLES